MRVLKVSCDSSYSNDSSAAQLSSAQRGSAAVAAVVATLWWQRCTALAVLGSS